MARKAMSLRCAQRRGKSRRELDPWLSGEDRRDPGRRPTFQASAAAAFGIALAAGCRQAVVTLGSVASALAAQLFHAGADRREIIG
jgi:hypothetical protein